MIRLLLADDEAPARMRLRRLLATMDGVDVVAEAEHGEQVLEACRRLQPDIVLLDIRMPGMDGIVCARQLAGMDVPPAVIFCTAWDDYAMPALKAQASSYLLKPIDRDELEKAIRSCQKINRAQLLHLQPPGEDESITLRSGASEWRLPLSSIAWFEVVDGRVIAIHDDGEHVLEPSLSELERHWPQQLIRSHRAALLNRSRLKALHKGSDGSYSVELARCGRRAPVSRRHISDVRQALRGQNPTPAV